MPTSPPVRSRGRSPVRLGRRAVTAGGATALLSALLSACQGGAELDLPGVPQAGENADQDRVLAAHGDEAAMVARLEQTRRRHPELRRTLTGALRTHRAHLSLLEGMHGVPSARSKPVKVPRSAKQALASVVKAERALADRHVRTAMSSRSGALAQVVASMSAAAAQQSAALTSGGGGAS